jgi:glucose/arabinose dehydrogenase
VTYDLRARPLLVLVLLLVAAASVALFMLERSRKSNDSGSSSGVPAAVAPKAHTAAPKTTARPKPKPKATPRPAKAPTPADQLPAPIRRALAADNVVVVSLYNPNAKTEGTAMREARAGAEQAGTSFVPVDVRKNNLASLNALYGVLQDPAVLVLRPPGSLVVRIDGFADRETVAQAALNAAS